MATCGAIRPILPFVLERSEHREGPDPGLVFQHDPAIALDPNAVSQSHIIADLNMARVRDHYAALQPKAPSAFLETRLHQPAPHALDGVEIGQETRSASLRTRTSSS